MLCQLFSSHISIFITLSFQYMNSLYMCDFSFTVDDRFVFLMIIYWELTYKKTESDQRKLLYLICFNLFSHFPYGWLHVKYLGVSVSFLHCVIFNTLCSVILYTNNLMLLISTTLLFEFITSTIISIWSIVCCSNFLVFCYYFYIRY